MSSESTGGHAGSHVSGNGTGQVIPNPATSFPRHWVMLGAGGHARSLYALLSALNGRVIVIAGEPRGAWADSIRVIESDQAAFDLAVSKGYGIALGIGSNSVRSAVYERGESPNSPPIIGATATVSPDVSLGFGSAVFEHAHVGPGVVVGLGVILNTATVVEHDSRIGDFVHIAPGAVVLGGASIGRLSLIGAGAIVLPGVEVGDDCVVGAGSVVTKNVESGATVVGVPAKPNPRTSGRSEV